MDVACPIWTSQGVGVWGASMPWERNDNDRIAP